MKILLEGKNVVLSPQMAVGKGGEADIYHLGGGTAVKIFKTPEHPDYAGFPEEQQAAGVRIAIHQRKLPLFPRGLPERVIAPQAYAFSPDDGHIVGYAMKYLKDAFAIRNLASPNSAGYEKNEISLIFRELHHVLQDLHMRQLIIGDFNDLNVLLYNREPFLIDTDSFQFGAFPCGVFSARFLDPLLCNESSPVFQLQKSYSGDSDWYSFAVVVMQSFLSVGPYGGVYVPADPSVRVSQELRPLRRISIFHPEVRYPSSARPVGVLTDEMIEYFRKVFLDDMRGVFPVSLLNSLYWKKCSQCGLEFAGKRCPSCSFTVAVNKDIYRIDSIETTCIFKTRGRIVASSLCQGRLHWLYEEEGVFFREKGNEVFRGTLSGAMKSGIAGDRTIIGQGNRLVIFSPGKPPLFRHVDLFQSYCSFEACESGIFYLSRGRLLHHQDGHDSFLGEVLEGQTLFHAGPAFGLGFYRAGAICRAFLFDGQRKALNDSLDTPYLRKNVIEGACYFSREYCWFFLVTEEQGRIIHRCLLISARGTIEAREESLCGDGTWLGMPVSWGKCAAGAFLLTLTDDGLCFHSPRVSYPPARHSIPEMAGSMQWQKRRLFL